MVAKRTPREPYKHHLTGNVGRNHGYLYPVAFGRNGHVAWYLW